MLVCGGLGSPPGLQSPDGKHVWDGTKWVPVAPSQLADAASGAKPGASFWRSPVAWILAAALLIVVLGGFGWYVSNQSCTVGYVGTDLQVTAVGLHAHDFCNSFKEANATSAYDLDQPDTTATLICRYTLGDGTTVTVRDRGVLKLYGNAECQQLAQDASGQALPTP